VVAAQKAASTQQGIPIMSLKKLPSNMTRRTDSKAGSGACMKPAIPKPQRYAIYTRKSTEHNLNLEFNSLDAQREACEAYIKSQAHEGWRLIPVTLPPQFNPS
jgi:hypothetical protein